MRTLVALITAGWMALAVAGCPDAPRPAYCMETWSEEECQDYCPRYYWYQVHETEETPCGDEVCAPGQTCCYCETDEVGNPV